MREAPKYFRWDFTPREMERLESAERRSERGGGWGRDEGRRRKNTMENEVWAKRGRVTVEEKGRTEGVRAVDTSTRARHAWLVREAPISQLDG